MISIEVDEQELFEIIMALHAFQKTDAEHSVEGEARKYEELAERRAKLLEKLHDIFDANATVDDALPTSEGSRSNILEMTPRRP